MTSATAKMEKIRVSKKLNVDCISHKTIEALLKYLGLDPEDTKYGLDKKLNMSRIEIQGQKPNKLLMTMKPQKEASVVGGASPNKDVPGEGDDDRKYN